MPLDTYTNLQTAVLQGLARPGDPLVAPALPDMIRLFEIEAKRRLKTGGSETVTLINTVAGQATIVMPADCGEVRAADIMTVGLTDVEPLQYLSPQSSSVGLNVSGRPRFYTLSGSSDKVGAVMRLVPVPDAVYTIAIDYLSDLPPLTEANQSNWLLRSNPDLYYFGALVEAEMYVGHDERVTMWLQRRDLAFAALEKADIKARWAGPLQLRVDAITTGGFGRGAGSSSGGGNGGNGGTGVAYLDDLLDVDTTGVAPGMVLAYTAPNWVAVPPSTATVITPIDGLSDVNAPSPVDWDLLRWQGPDWVSTTPSAVPATAEGGTKAWTFAQRFSEAVDIKDFHIGDGAEDAVGVAAFINKLREGYTHGGPVLAATARAGHVPGGIFEPSSIAANALVVGDAYTIVSLGTSNFLAAGSPSNVVGTNFVATANGTGTGTVRPLLRSSSYSWTLGGDGPLSQLRDINIELDHNRCNVQNLHLITAGSNVDDPGAGIDIRAGLNFIFNVDINDKEVGIKNTTAFTAGGFSSNTTVLGGWLRGNRTAVKMAQNDMRLAFVRISDSVECGLDYFDQGGDHVIGCNVGGLHGPALRFRGKRTSFTGDTNGTDTISNVSDFSGIAIDDVLGSGATGINFAWNTRVVGINEGAGTLTIAPPAISSTVGLAINITNAPVESFWVNNTLNMPDGANFLVSQIASIVQGPTTESIIVTFTQPHWGVVLNESRCRITGTGITSYDDELTFAEKIVEAIPSTTQVQLNYPYSGSDYTAPAPISFVGNMTVGSAVITGIASTAALAVDMAVTIPTPGHGLKWEPTAPRIASKTATTVTLKYASSGAPAEATLTKTGVTFTAGPAFSVLGFNMEVKSEDANFWVKDQFFLGNNSNFISMQGGCDFNLIGMRVPGKLYMDGVRPFIGTRTVGSPVVTAIDIPTTEFRVGLPIAGTGIPVGAVVQSIDSSTQITLSKAATIASSNTLRSPWQPNFLFHIPVVTSAAASDCDVVHPQGPGSLTGWGQMCMFPIGSKSFASGEGVFYVGARVPYTQGGMLNGAPADLNLYGAMTSGFRIRSNGIQYDIQGNKFKVRGGEINFEESTFTSQSSGTGTLLNGIDMYTATRAYRSTAGTTYGNAVHRFDAPRSTALEGETSTMGYIVAPGNSSDEEGSLFFGAHKELAPLDAPVLSGDRDSIRKLASVIEIASGNVSTPATSPRISGWKTAAVPTDPGDEWFRLSGGQPNSFINVDQNIATRFFVSNPNTGDAAVASIGARQIPTSPASGVRIEVYGTGFASTTTSLADGASMLADTALSGGLTLGAIATGADVRVFAGGAVPGNLALTIAGANQRAVFTEAVVWKPPATVTGAVATNGQFTIEAASDTEVKLVRRGLDGVIRKSTAITLS